MEYSIIPVQEADIPRVTDLICEGIIQDGIPEFVAATWPGMDTADGRAEARSRFLSLRKHLHDPTHFLKVVDPSDGSIVACTVCFYNSQPPTSLPGLAGEGWKTEDERTYASHLREERNRLLLRIFARLQGPVTGMLIVRVTKKRSRLHKAIRHLEIMAFFVDSSLQRRGIGTFLMQHLIHLDKQREVPLVVISFANSKMFYRKNGFRVEEDAVLAVPEQWSEKPPSRLTSLIYQN